MEYRSIAEHVYYRPRRLIDIRPFSIHTDTARSAVAGQQLKSMEERADESVS